MLATLDVALIVFLAGFSVAVVGYVVICWRIEDHQGQEGRRLAGAQPGVVNIGRPFDDYVARAGIHYGVAISSRGLELDVVIGSSFYPEGGGLGSSGELDGQQA